MKTSISEKQLYGLYWFMRASIACIWLWTAFVSWFIYPQAESLAWLHQVGLGNQTLFWLASACLFDLFMGIVSALFASRKVWQTQFFFVVLYTLIIAFKLPEFLFHPFGPIIKNMAVLACLVFLILVE